MTDNGSDIPDDMRLDVDLAAVNPLATSIDYSGFRLDQDPPPEAPAVDDSLFLYLELDPDPAAYANSETMIKMERVMQRQRESIAAVDAALARQIPKE